jgi:hypothetical protein
MWFQRKLQIKDITYPTALSCFDVQVVQFVRIE